jgi:hypothetical protein
MSMDDLNMYDICVDDLFVLMDDLTFLRTWYCGYELVIVTVMDYM